MSIGATLTDIRNLEIHGICTDAVTSFNKPWLTPAKRVLLVRAGKYSTLFPVSVMAADPADPSQFQCLHLNTHVKVEGDELNRLNRVIMVPGTPL